MRGIGAQETSQDHPSAFPPRRFLVLLLLAGLAIAPALALAAGDARSYRYVGGAYWERQVLSSGGVCTASQVDGGRRGRRLRRSSLGREEDDGLGRRRRVAEGIGALRGGPLPLGAPGGSAPHVTCAHGATAWGWVSIDVPEGCESANVFLSEAVTTGTIRVGTS